jgi:serine/threonine protein kinase
LEEGTPAEAIDLIERLLDYVPSSRITAEQALKHKFFEEIT